jgi:hypothetical protein
MWPLQLIARGKFTWEALSITQLCCWWKRLLEPVENGDNDNDAGSSAHWNSMLRLSQFTSLDYVNDIRVVKTFILLFIIPSTPPTILNKTLAKNQSDTLRCSDAINSMTFLEKSHKFPQYAILFIGIVK